MKFCYIDESGTGDEPVAVSVGIVVDSHRMHRTKKDWAELLSELNRITTRPISEIHTRDLYNGNGPWYGVSGSERATIIDGIISWLIDRKHKITFSAINKDIFLEKLGICPFCKELKSNWRIATFHVVLSLQKAHKRFKKTKGHTVIVLDREVMEETHFSDLIYEPPSWSGIYYGKSENEEHLSNIVDVPFFGDSKKILLIQLADLTAYILRRNSELKDFSFEEKYQGETHQIESWVKELSKTMYPCSTRYKKSGRSALEETLFELAPSSLRNI